MLPEQILVIKIIGIYVLGIVGLAALGMGLTTIILKKLNAYD